jgi:two-component system, LytTR family, response regulator LytT
MEKEAMLKTDNKTQISFSIRLADRMYFVAVDTIAFMYLDNEKVYLVDFKGNQHGISKTLEALEKAVAPQQFHRINRQVIVNREAIKDVEPYFNQRLVVHLTVPTPENILVPRFKVKPFLNWVENG